MHALPLPPTAPTPPLHLPRLVMRRAAWVSALVLGLAVAIGLPRMNQDIDDEVDAAMTLAALVARLGSLSHTDDATALQALRQLQAEHPLRHLVLRVHAADGQALLQPPVEPPAAWPLRPLLRLHRELLSPPDQRQVTWTVPRPDGGSWQVGLAASHDSERREAMTNFIGTLGLLLACVLGLLLVMHWNLRQAFAPLGRLLAAMAGIEHGDTRAVQALPAMPIRELAVVAAALGHLARALDDAEDQRRLLARQVLTLQDDERARLARELHDEFGQRLAALRVDAAWLARRTEDQPALQAVVQGMAGQCQQIQHDIRALLARLQPFGSGSGPVPLAQLLALLQSLVAAWAEPARGDGLPVGWQLQWLGEDGQPQPAPPADLQQRLALPADLALTLYRISQEALTNVARHAQARQAGLQLALSGPAEPGAAVQIRWQVSDDGSGLTGPADSLRRGNGLAGVRERIWAQGADLQLGPHTPDAARRGLRLAAQFSSTWEPA